jgi:hypothetical protein
LRKRKAKLQTLKKAAGIFVSQKFQQLFYSEFKIRLSLRQPCFVLLLKGKTHIFMEAPAEGGPLVLAAVFLKYGALIAVELIDTVFCDPWNLLRSSCKGDSSAPLCPSAMPYGWKRMTTGLVGSAWAR